ncbi:MAG: TolC family protein [Brevinematia bacterium]
MKNVKILFWFILILFWGYFSYAQVIKIQNVDEAIKIGLENNKDLKTKLLDVMSANANLKGALADIILPSVNASFKLYTFDPNTLESGISKVTSFQIVTNVVMGVTNIAMIPKESTVTNVFADNYSLGVSASYRVPYLLPFGLDISYNSYLLQLKNKEIADLQYQKAVNDYIYNLKIAYYNYLFAKEFAKISQETDKRLEENVRIAEANYAAGIFSDLDLIRAKVQLINNKPNLYSSSNNVRIQKLNLINLLGLDINEVDNIEILGNIEDIKREFSNVVIDFDYYKSVIPSTNPDLAILKRLIDLSEISKNVSLSANKPTVALFFNYTYELKKTNNFENERYWKDSWTAGIQLNIPISELIPISKSYANMENADYSISKSKQNYETTLNLINIQIDQIKLKINENLQNISAQEANVEQAKRSLDIITQRYSYGNASSLDLIDAQLAYQQAELNLLSSWVSYVNNILNLYKLSGFFVDGGKKNEREN